MYDFKLTPKNGGRALYIGTHSGDYWRGAYRVQSVGGRAFTLHGWTAFQHFADNNGLRIDWL